jgi:long-chain acyl-CoA synthetase
MVVGGRLKGMLCGGAVLSEDTQRFVQAALCVTVFQGYGLTETCAAGTIADRNYLFILIFIYFFLLFKKNMI